MGKKKGMSDEVKEGIEAYLRLERSMADWPGYSSYTGSYMRSILNAFFDLAGDRPVREFRQAVNQKIRDERNQESIKQFDVVLKTRGMSSAKVENSFGSRVYKHDHIQTMFDGFVLGKGYKWKC